MAKVIKQGKCRYELLRLASSKAKEDSEGHDVEASFSALNGLLPPNGDGAPGKEQAGSKTQEKPRQEPPGPRHRQLIEAEIERAKAEAKAIVQEAKEKAQAIVEEAEQKAEEIESQAYAIGYEQGQKDGLEIGRQQFQIKVQHLESAMAELKQQSEALSSKYEAQMVQIALAVARQILGRELTESAQTVASAVSRAMESVVAASTVTIHLNPRDYEAVKDQLAEDLQTPGGTKVRLESNQSVSRGGCLLETDFGLVDATMESKWTAVVEEIDLALRERTGVKVWAGLKSPPKAQEEDPVRASRPLSAEEEGHAGQTPDGEAQGEAGKPSPPTDNERAQEKEAESAAPGGEPGGNGMEEASSRSGEDASALSFPEKASPDIDPGRTPR